MKKIVEVIHPNTAMRTFAHTVNIDGIDTYVSMYSKSTEVPEAAKTIAAKLWEIDAVKNVSFSRGETRVEVSDAWEGEWSHVSPLVLDVINQELFGGEAEHSVRDDAAKYEANRSRESWY